ncbi:gamma-glutamylcyclotransferase-like isoform X2 [Sitodiplosis mosellana]|nr:gamma-glutamylcyclotransferase-like isoform X2 [Sitodiplosis mosellana]
MPEEYVSSNRSKFLYFAYGSNMWTKRIHMRNPSAVRKGSAQLKGYRLDFYQPVGEPSPVWNGSRATVVEDENYTVWGAVYEIDLKHLPSLDAQEGVNSKRYVPITKEIVTSDEEVLTCRSYQLTEQPTNAVNLSDPTIPLERKPSKTYIDVIMLGAEENQLPEEYLGFLKRIVHNGRLASAKLLEELFGKNQ